MRRRADFAEVKKGKGGLRQHICHTKPTEDDIPGNINDSFSSKATSSQKDVPESTLTTFPFSTGKDMRVVRGLDPERRKVSPAA